MAPGGLGLCPAGLREAAQGQSRAAALRTSRKASRSRERSAPPQDPGRRRPRSSPRGLRSPAASRPRPSWRGEAPSRGGPGASPTRGLPFWAGRAACPSAPCLWPGERWFLLPRAPAPQTRAWGAPSARPDAVPSAFSNSERLLRSCHFSSPRCFQATPAAAPPDVPLPSSSSPIHTLPGRQGSSPNCAPCPSAA